MDSECFSKFLKYLQELRRETLDHYEREGISVSPDSFLVFLDKLSRISHSPHLNELILKLIADINIDSLNSKQLLNKYQEHSVDFKFEEKIRMGQIKQFAEEVIP